MPSEIGGHFFYNPFNRIDNLPIGDWYLLLKIISVSLPLQWLIQLVISDQQILHLLFF